MAPAMLVARRPDHARDLSDKLFTRRQFGDGLDTSLVQNRAPSPAYDDKVVIVLA